VRRRMVVFAALVTTPIAHSIEEYIGHLSEVLPPARVVSGPFSSNLSRGFVVFNLCVIVLGVLCLAVPIARAWPAARPIAWSWSLVERLNGVGHLLRAFAQGGYFPGLVTAPALIAFAILLMRDLRQPA